MADSVTLHEGVNTLPLATYGTESFSSVNIRNADNTPYYSEVAPGSVQYGDSDHEYSAEWEVLPEYPSSHFYMENNIVRISGTAFLNAVIFGKTYQVRFE